MYKQLCRHRRDSAPIRSLLAIYLIRPQTENHHPSRQKPKGDQRNQIIASIYSAKPLFQRQNNPQIESINYGSFTTSVFLWIRTTNPCVSGVHVDQRKDRLPIPQVHRHVLLQMPHKSMQCECRFTIIFRPLSAGHENVVTLRNLPYIFATIHTLNEREFVEALIFEIQSSVHRSQTLY